jgi:hypothetical protein
MSSSKTSVILLTVLACSKNNSRIIGRTNALVGIVLRRWKTSNNLCFDERVVNFCRDSLFLNQIKASTSSFRSTSLLIQSMQSTTNITTQYQFKRIAPATCSFLGSKIPPAVGTLVWFAPPTLKY